MGLIFESFDYVYNVILLIITLGSGIRFLYKKAKGEKSKAAFLMCVGIILFIAFFCWRGLYVEIPNVTNLTYDAAKQLLKDKGFECNDDDYDSNAIIVQQYIGVDKKYTIEEKRYAMKNEYIYLEIEGNNKKLNQEDKVEEFFTIPNLMYNSYLYAVERLYALGAGEVVTEYKYSENIIADVVIGVEPEIGTVVAKGEKVTIYVSKNKFSTSQLYLSDEDYSNFIIENTQLLNYVGNEKIVYIPEGVEYIGEAFCQIANNYVDYSCIEEVILPDSVKVIGQYAFYELPNLKRITLSQNLEYIDAYAFSGCTNLEEIIIPNSVKYIGTQAFMNCTNLKNIVLPENITIGYEAFIYSGLKEVYISDNVKLHSFAFAGCKDLEQINIPDNIEIDEGCFAVTPWLRTIDEEFLVINNRLVYYNGIETEIQIPQKVEVIDAYAFYDNKYVSKVIMGKDVKEIGEKAFSDCVNLKEVSATSNLKYVSRDAFFNTVWLNNYESSFVMLGDEILIKYKGNEEEVVIPNDVKRISAAAFANISNIKDIQMGDNVVEIGYAAFSGCSNLETIYLSNELSIIPSQCFLSCLNLKEIDFPDDTKYIGEDGFRGCISLNQVLFNDTLNVIGSGAFSNCSSLIALDIPQSVDMIEKYAFFNCTGIKNINFSYGIKYIEEGAFATCTDLVKVTLPDSVIQLGRGAFMSCSNLSKVYLGSIKDINASTFLYCTNLREVDIPKSVLNIRYRAFEGCYNLKNISLPYDLKFLGDTSFFACGLEQVVIPSNVQKIGRGAFGQNYDLKEVNISNGVEEIEYKAFGECLALEKIYIPYNVKLRGNILDENAKTNIIRF